MYYCKNSNARDVVTLVVAIDIANVHLGLWSSSHSSVACFLVCKISKSAVASYRHRFFASVGGLRVKSVGGIASNDMYYYKKYTNKTSKKILNRFSTGCRDVQAYQAYKAHNQEGTIEQQHW